MKTRRFHFERVYCRKCQYKDKSDHCIKADMYAGTNPGIIDEDILEWYVRAGEYSKYHFKDLCPYSKVIILVSRLKDL